MTELPGGGAAAGEPPAEEPEVAPVLHAARTRQTLAAMKILLRIGAPLRPGRGSALTG
jgi:hypothetical protein